MNDQDPEPVEDPGPSPRVIDRFPTSRPALSSRLRTRSRQRIVDPPDPTQRAARIGYDKDLRLAP
ncbi:MAG: hypothetical protein M0C28_40180 [Candidatus Moduliflexus flocculans]|nr:hypothetical protein [Candidatus Moduliflexus flocculans]